MNQEVLNELKNRAENNLLEDETYVLLYIQIASRLKALGDSSAYDKIAEITARSEFSDHWEDILLQRARQGIWDINVQLGEELGFTLIECQDFALYYEYSQEDSSFPPKLDPWFETWVNTANEVEIDEETRDVLVRYLLTYPIPEDLQIGVVAAPVTEEMYDLLTTLGEQIPVPEIHSEWQPPAEEKHASNESRQKASSVSPYVVACDDGEISEFHLQCHDRLSCCAKTPAGTFRVQQMLTSNGRLMIEIHAEEDDMPPVDSVRAGMIPAFTDEKHCDEGLWWINLKDYDPRFWHQILDSPIIITQRGRFVWTIQMPKNG